MADNTSTSKGKASPKQPSKYKSNQNHLSKQAAKPRLPIPNAYNEFIKSPNVNISPPSRTPVQQPEFHSKNTGALNRDGSPTSAYDFTPIYAANLRSERDNSFGVNNKQSSSRQKTSMQTNTIPTNSFKKNVLGPKTTTSMKKHSITNKTLPLTQNYQKNQPKGRDSVSKTKNRVIFEEENSTVKSKNTEIVSTDDYYQKSVKNMRKNTSREPSKGPINRALTTAPGNIDQLGSHRSIGSPDYTSLNAKKKNANYLNNRDTILPKSYRKGSKNSIDFTGENSTVTNLNLKPNIPPTPTSLSNTLKPSKRTFLG